MTEAEIGAAIAAVLHRIAPEADPSAVDPAADLRQALDIDSFDYLNLLVGLHEKLGVEIPEADYAQVRTLAGLTRYLAARTARSERV